MLVTKVLLLALPMAITARGLLIYMSIEGADFSVAHAVSLRAFEEEEEEPPPIDDDPDSLANVSFDHVTFRIATV